MAAAISLALAMQPVMPLAGSVRTSVAPNALGGEGSVEVKVGQARGGGGG